MRFRYVEWDESRHGVDKSTFEELLDLFKELLYHTGGDVEEALEWLEQLDEEYDLTDDDMTLEDFVDELKKQGYIEDDEEGQGMKLTAKSERSLRQESLEQIFSQLKKGGTGQHRTSETGQGPERLPETRKWQFGDDPHHLDTTKTFSNAFRRSGVRNWNLREEDFEVHDTNHHANMATVMMIDLSHSMVLYGEDRITPARKTALALAELIMQQYKDDTLDIVAFGDDAWEVSVEELPYLEVGPYHTNTLAGLQRARQILHRRNNRNKQIFMITDGKPSAQFENDGRLYKNPYGLDPRIVNRVLDEAVKCRREEIPITTFMVARDPYLQDFVKKLTEANRGRAYYADLNNLGEYIFEDYIRNRRRRIR